MSLTRTIDQDLASAMKDGQADRVAVLRLIKNALKNEQIRQGHELNDQEEAKVLQREAKQRRDSIEAYKQGGRDELAAAEQAELAVIESYLPEQLDEAALAKLVDEAIMRTGATTKAQMGQVIGLVMKQAGGAADGATISRLAGERLG